MSAGVLVGESVGDSARTPTPAIPPADLPGASTTVPGAVTLAGDLGGTAASPRVLSTHLTSPLPAAQGGLGSTAGAGAVFAAATASITPSATSATYGTASTLTPGTGFTGLMPTAVDIVTTSVGSETVTVQCVATYSDTTTTTTTYSITSSTTTSLTVAQMIALLAGGNGLRVVSLAWNCKSSISSSTAAATVNVLGLNHN